MKHSASSRDRQIFGKLGSVSFNDIIQLLGMSKRTATLELRRGEERGHVYFRDGQIIHATAGRYEGEESFIELLGWGDADFSVEEGIETLPKISITKTTEALLLSTMTALDEVGRITERPPIRVAPQIAKRTRRLPPRPKPRARSKTKLAVVLVGVGSAFAASLVALALNPSLWKASSMGAPWDGLPIVNSPRRPQSTLGVPDAWSVAHAAWERPTPIPAVTTTTTTIAMTAALEPAYLTVVVEPWARVDVDGSAVGETPLGRVELTAGTHHITLSNDHVVGVIRDVVVLESGESVTKRYSFNDTGYLRLVVTPWADVSVDGRSIGQTPLARIAIPAGSHVVRFVHPELGATERNVEIVSGRTALVKLQLQ